MWSQQNVTKVIRKNVDINLSFDQVGFYAMYIWNLSHI